MTNRRKIGESVRGKEGDH